MNKLEPVNWIEKGEEKGLIKLSSDEKRIKYIHHDISRDYSKPEAKIEALAYLSLVMQYGYPPERIRLFQKIPIGAYVREADLEVFEDATPEKPLIIVECKNETISEAAFRQAVDQAFSYALAEGAKYVWTTSGIKNEYYEVPSDKPKSRRLVSDIPCFGAKGLSPYRYGVNGGLTKNGQKTFALKVVTENELTRRFAQAYQALWGGGEMNPSDAFDEFDKLVFCKIWDERKVRADGAPYEFQIIVEDTVDATNVALLNRLKKLYEEGRKQAPEIFKDDIRLSPGKVRTVVSYLEDVNLSETNLDAKGKAFEDFITSYFRGNFGQFFTPRVVVKFIIGALPIQSDWRVLDTSCGSGGFLLHALDKVRHAANDYYGANTRGAYNAWHEFASKRLFGIEINDKIARTAKMNMIIHDDGHTNVVVADGLRPIHEIADLTCNHDFRDESFDCIITNPPFGSLIRQTEHAYTKLYGLSERGVDWLNPKSKASRRPGVPSEVLFIEQCWHFLSEGGYLAIVLPDGILTNASMQYVRDWIVEKFRILAVVSLPQTTFKSTGAGEKSSILFLRKRTHAQTTHLLETKTSLRLNVAEKGRLTERLAEIESVRKTEHKNLDARREFVALSPNERKKNTAYKQEADKIAARAEKATAALRGELSKLFDRKLKADFPDEDVFMAIAEDVGFDAAGKPTKVNELEEIGKRLAEFIRQEAETR